MFGLLVTPKPLMDESFYGYLYRLAHANGLAGLEVVAMHRSCMAAGQKEWVKIHSSLSWLLSVEELLHPATEAIKAWSPQHRKCCSQCLEESQHWRDLWDLTLVTCCPVHKNSLHDHCSVCGAQFKPGVMATFECTECGTSLSFGARSIRADPMALWVTCEFERRLRHAPTNSDPLSHLTINEFHELAKRFGVRESHSVLDKPLKLAGAGALAVAIPLATAAGQILKDWPHGFWAFLDKLAITRQAVPGWKLGSVFGQTYKDIHSGLKGAAFQFIRDTFGRYVECRWEGPLARRNRYLRSDTITSHRWVSIRAAAKKVNVPSALLHRMVANGELPHREMKYPSGRNGLVVDYLELTVRAEQLKHAVSLEEAASCLSITKPRVRQLLDAGLLRSLGGKPSPGERWWIDGSSLINLGTALPCPPMTDGLVSVTQLAKLELPTKGSFVELIASIQKGKINAYFVNPDDGIALGKWLVPRYRISSIYRNSPNLSVVEAAFLLGIKQEVAYALIRSGLLTSYPIRSGRRTAHCVPQEAIREFNQSFVLGPELARINKTSLKSIPPLMREHGVLPVVGPGVVGANCRQYVWPRLMQIVGADVELTLGQSRTSANN